MSIPNGNEISKLSIDHNTCALSITRELESFIDQLADAVSLCDKNGVIQKVNPAFVELFGWQEHEVIGLRLPMIPERHWEEADRSLTALMQGTPKAVFQVNVVNKFHALFPASITVTVLRNQAGDIIGFTGIIRDLSQMNRMLDERKIAEKALLEAEEKYRSLVEEALVGVYLFQNGKLVYINPRFAEIFGYNPKDLVMTDPVVLIVPQDRAAFGELINRIYKDTHFNINMEAKGVSRNGSLVYFELSGKYTVYNGAPALIGTVLDITERKKIDQMVRESNQRYRRLMDLSPEPIIVHSDGIIVYTNDACMKLLGAEDPSRTIGTSVFDFLPPDTHKLAKQRIQELAAAKDKLGSLEYQIMTMSGEVKQVEMSSTLFDEIMGTPLIQTVIRDVTEKKKTEEMLRRSDKLSALGQMAAGIAHEIRNPLTSLKGFVQLMKAQKPDRPEYLDIMLTELDRINFIVSEFMKIAKPQPTDFSFKHVGTIAADIVSLMQSQAILHKTQITLNIKDELPPILCDENHLKQVLLNVLKNAIEAMPQGGEIVIELSLEPGGQVKISITDQGPGIPEKYLSKLGDPFFTTKESGTGLGLMVCYQIIEAHKGTMHITSKQGVGTTVHICLPA
ncbi:PAS domain-containing sensor histidine kinase [Paenibacillus cremeus]|uniref:histidine kinase n=1 Tax=Paenibacillus cremeus TaxID=2163881 RepID=A0A559JKD6_9BACL|nr:PAS domain-containing sensor histidine kinase [Paenibacillus cremeus]TVY00351.1 PAS domain S-box protein [Paenibacillus cremeus]